MNISSTKDRSIHPPVFFTSAGLLVVFLLFGVLATDVADRFFPAILAGVGAYFGWFYLASVGGFLGLSVWLAFSSHGTLRLGADDDRPEFSTLTWFAMLFSAGMGIGLVFNGVAEPMMHFASPPVGEGGTVEAAVDALPRTFLHWGVHAWAIYAIVALGIAFFSFRHRLPLTLRSCLYPLLGERIHGWPGDVVDVLAVIGTLFGLACSLGLGAMQVSAGLNEVFGIPHGTTTQLVVIMLITLAATVSLVTGIKSGIRRLSELNMVMAALLLIFVATVGPTFEIIRLGLQSIGIYLDTFLERTFFLGALDAQQATWINDWTIVYWGWWIAWAPFVGVFVARISRGRTIREFLAAVLLVPTLVNFVWFSVFGGTALNLELSHGVDVSGAVTEDLATAVYVVLAELPGSSVSAVIAMVVVAIFFVTSSDSASLVVDMITSGGKAEPPVWQRIFWATAEGATAGVLLYAGGDVALKALQAGVVSMGLPFCVVLVLVSVSLVLGLQREARGDWLRPKRESRNAQPPVKEVEGIPVKLDNILVPVDYSEPSARAVEHAISLAQMNDPAGRITVLHISTTGNSSLPLERLLKDDAPTEEELRSAVRESEEELMRRFLERFPDYPLEGQVEIGVPWKKIVSVAGDSEFDAIVMGSHGRSKIDDLLMGSVAQRVIRYTERPVLVVS